MNDGAMNDMQLQAPWIGDGPESSPPRCSKGHECESTEDCIHCNEPYCWEHSIMCQFCEKTLCMRCKDITGFDDFSGLCIYCQPELDEIEEERAAAQERAAALDAHIALLTRSINDNTAQLKKMLEVRRRVVEIIGEHSDLTVADAARMARERK